MSHPLHAPLPSFSPPAGAMPMLVLDDERFDRHRVARLCSGLDFPCHIRNATNLADFAALLDSEAFDLILLDYQLPDGTGLDALEMVRLSPRNVNAPTIMITGQGQDRLAESARAKGCAGYLTKDALTTANFQRAVQDALRSSRAIARSNLMTHPRSDVERLMEVLASTCARDVKPMISRIMRQVRDLRTASAGAQTTQRLDGLNESCLAIWEYLVDLERTAGTDLMDRAAHTYDPPGPPRTRPRKPPSPFKPVQQ